MPVDGVSKRKGGDTPSFRATRKRSRRETKQEQEVAEVDPRTLELLEACSWNIHTNANRQRSWKNFSAVLADLMLPQIIDRSDTPRTDASGANRITIVFLTEPDNRCGAGRFRAELGRLVSGLEGGQQSPGDVFLVFSPIWLIKDGPDMFLKKGVWFDRLHQGYCDSFEPPRLVTFFSDFMTQGATDGLRDDGPALELNLRCPMSSSSLLEYRVNDKVLTRCLLGNSGVGVPRTLAFPYKSDLTYPVGQLQMIMEKLDSKEGCTPDFFLAQLKQFLERFSDIKAVVVKPSGRMWCGSRMVKIFRHINDLPAIANAMFEVLQELSPSDCLMVDEFLPTLRSQMVLKGREVQLRPALAPSSVSETHTSAFTMLEQMEQLMDLDPDIEVSTHGKQMPVVLGFRIRLLVAKPPWGEPVVSKFVVGVGDMNKPIHGDNTVPQWGITDPTYKATLTSKIQDEGRSALRAIINYEEGLSVEEKGCERAQTRLVGLDIILTNKNSVVSPYVIEVNDHDCTLQSQMLEMLFPTSMGECVRPWIANMITDSQRFLMDGRRVVIVGAGGYSKNWVYRVAQELNLELCVIDEHSEHYAKAGVAHWIHYPDLVHHQEDEAHTEELVKILEEMDFEPEGVVTFWEDCTPITALLASKLNLIGNSYDAHFAAKSKFLTQFTLMNKVGSWPHKVSTHFFAIPSVKINSPSEIKEALKKVPLPAVVKLEHGCSAVGVKLVTDKKELLMVYKQITAMFVNEDDRPGCGLGYKPALILAQYVEGSEHDVDVVLWEGKTLAAFVTDNGPTRVPYFAETSAWMPTALHRDQEAALKAAGIQCCLELGLHTGVFNIEMKLTSTGPRLIEINARTGGFYIHNWIKSVWGVDLAFCAFSIACGIKPLLYPSPEPLTHIVGMNCYASQHGKALSLEHLQDLNDRGYIRLNQFEHEVVEYADYEEPICNVACQSPYNLVDAKEKLLNTIGVLGLDCGDVPAKWYFCPLSEDWLS